MSDPRHTEKSGSAHMLMIPFSGAGWISRYGGSSIVLGDTGYKVVCTGTIPPGYTRFRCKHWYYLGFNTAVTNYIQVINCDKSVNQVKHNAGVWLNGDGCWISPWFSLDNADGWRVGFTITHGSAAWMYIEGVELEFDTG